MRTERGVRFCVGPMFRIPELSGVLEGGSEVREPAQRFLTSYLDTSDLRLARWGCALRYRSEHGWTVELPEPDRHPLEPRELRFDGGPARPPGEAMDLLRAYVRSAPIRPAARLQTVRTTTRLRDDDGGALASIVDDEVSVLDGRRVAARFREIEVKLSDGARSEVLDPVVTCLMAAGAEETAVLREPARALLPLSGEPPDIVPVRAGRSATVREIVCSSIAASAIRMLRHDAGVRLGEDPEAVHQARVAVRRLRSDLRTFRSLLDPAWTAALRQELGWLGQELGVVRDLDVLAERLRLAVMRVPDADAETAPKLLERLRSARAAARADLMSAMREPRYVDLLDRVVEAANEPLVLPEAAKQPAAAAMGRLMDGPWMHLERACSELDPASTDAELHHARIRAKRVRYAADTLAPLFGARARKFSRRAAALQEILGKHQDAVVAIAWLRRQATGTTAAVAFTAGELAGVEARDQASARTAWSHAWERLDSRKVRFWT